MTRIACATALFFLTATPLAAGEPAPVVRLSEPVEVTDSYEVFGAPLAAGGATLSLAELVARSDEYLDSEVHVTTRVAKVCQKKGCFFIAQDGPAVARVTFRDYEFFIPTDSAGKEVTLTGMFTRKTLSAEQADHYAADLGRPASGSTDARAEYRIVATSVRVPKS
ncbi:MAG: DUF4920 domain-containing protein [Pseudomonadota bacterium]